MTWPRSFVLSSSMVASSSVAGSLRNDQPTRTVWPPTLQPISRKILYVIGALRCDRHLATPGTVIQSFSSAVAAECFSQDAGLTERRTRRRGDKQESRPTCERLPQAHQALGLS